jgi:hypothetical protein
VFGTDQKNAQGQAYLILDSPLISASGIATYNYSGTGSLAVPVLLTSLGIKGGKGSGMIVVPSSINGQGFSGPILAGVRYWDGDSEEITQLTYKAADGERLGQLKVLV